MLEQVTIDCFLKLPYTIFILIKTHPLNVNFQSSIQESQSKTLKASILRGRDMMKRSTPKVSNHETFLELFNIVVKEQIETEHGSYLVL